MSKGRTTEVLANGEPLQARQGTDRGLSATGGGWLSGEPGDTWSTHPFSMVRAKQRSVFFLDLRAASARCPGYGSVI